MSVGVVHHGSSGELIVANQESMMGGWLAERVDLVMVARILSHRVMFIEYLSQSLREEMRLGVNLRLLLGAPLISLGEQKASLVSGLASSVNILRLLGLTIVDERVEGMSIFD